MVTANDSMQPSNRVRLLTAPIDLAAGPGLEFGPLDRPVVDRKTSDVRYIDHLCTDELREKYREHPLVETSQVCDVDFVIDGSPLVDIVGAGYGYVVASHVAEHVPDFIGWLSDITQILRPGAILALALPDKRMTFDAARPLTLPSDLIGAHLAHRTVPTPEQVAEHHMMALRRGDQIAWDTLTPRSELRHVHDLAYAVDRTRDAARGAYVDVHCWVFTPQSFVENIGVLRSAGLTNLSPTGTPQSCEGEFITHLRLEDGETLPLHDDWDRLLCSNSADPPARHAELEAVYRSTSWRVTAPLRRLSSVIRSKGLRK